MSEPFREWVDQTTSIAQLVVMLAGIVFTIGLAAFLVLAVVIGGIGLLTGG